MSSDFMVAGALSESGIKHGSVIDAVVVVTEVCERFTLFRVLRDVYL